MCDMSRPHPSNRLDRVRALDRRLVKLARKIRILSSLSWPQETAPQFLERWRAKSPALPCPPVRTQDHTSTREALTRLKSELDPQDPLQAYLARTTQSYIDATHLLHAQGSPDFTARSIALYGRPTDRVHPTAPTNLEAAKTFLNIYGDRLPPPDPTDIPSEEAARLLQSWVNDAFSDPTLPVEVTPGLASLATAGSRRIRIRANTLFSQTQLEQLLQHEALVHSATARNGRAQPILSSMGLGGPRTTAMQEGLATLSEMITDTMDVNRLKRIALRIQAIQDGLNGADFIDLFKRFLEAGQTEEDAFHAAQRVFRGGDVRGRVVFTKDVIYLSGLLHTHTFLLKAVQTGLYDLPLRLFAGRMTLGDALELAPAFEDGTLAQPAVAPRWVRNVSRLSAFLIWSAFTHQIQLGPLSLRDLTVNSE